MKPNTMINTTIADLTRGARVRVKLNDAVGTVLWVKDGVACVRFVDAVGSASVCFRDDAEDGDYYATDKLVVIS
jgi:hypothetical protein